MNGLPGIRRRWLVAPSRRRREIPRSAGGQERIDLMGGKALPQENPNEHLRHKRTSGALAGRRKPAYRRARYRGENHGGARSNLAIRLTARAPEGVRCECWHKASPRLFGNLSVFDPRGGCRRKCDAELLP
jgi:hypothetical protein